MTIDELVAAARSGSTRAAGRLLSLVESSRRDEVLAAIVPQLGQDSDRATLDLAVQQARIDVDNARIERERLESLLKAGAIPERRVVVTQPTAGEFRGFGIVCTHDGCELNAVADGTINCPCHGSRYAITDGSVVQGPARTGLRVEQVAVDGDRVVLL